MKILTALLATLIILVVIGMAQNYFSNPVRGCREFYTGTEFRGFDCNGVQRFQR